MVIKRFNLYLLVFNLGLAVANILSLLLYFGGYVPNIVPLFLIMGSSVLFIAAGTRTVTMYSFTTNTGKCFMLLTIAGIISFFGEFHNSLTLYAGQFLKPLGLDDLFFASALICLGVGFYYAILGNKIVWTASKKKIMLIWSFMLFILLGIVYYFAIGKMFATIGVSIVYLIFSFLLSMAALRVLMATWEYRGGAIFKAWFSIFLGICFLVATIFALFMTVGHFDVNNYLSYIPLTLLAIAENCLTYGFGVLAALTKTIQERALTQI